MKAIVLHEYGGPGKLLYETVDDPVPQADEVLVRVSATSINPIDFKLRSGVMQAMMPLQLPTILGADISGVVRAVGSDVTGFREGQRVMALGDHAYAELAVVKAANLTLVPDNLDLTDAGALPLVTLTGQQLALRAAEVQPGTTVLVAGAIGGVGRTAVFAARQKGATVLAGVRKSQLEQGGKLGADQVIALDDTEALARLGFVDAVADCVGGKTAELLMGKVKQGGVFASVLGPPSNAGLHPTVRVNAMQVTPDSQALRTLAEDVAAGRLVIPIDRMLPLSDAGAGHTAAEKGGLGKVLLLA